MCVKISTIFLNVSSIDRCIVTESWRDLEISFRCQLMYFWLYSVLGKGFRSSWFADIIYLIVFVGLPIFFALIWQSFFAFEQN